ncbi:hypothetical protein rosag_19130 [Roseisolibacter agri]|uniref:Uncharacterized protein n=1 Tax=Roseisolibacter agri TaxID=2014610 RepID=A0AA37Q2J2_9BACT|nr:hypothetical protein rosag_19130 [Roseisolibacter agri]
MAPQKPTDPDEIEVLPIVLDDEAPLPELPPESLADFYSPEEWASAKARLLATRAKRKPQRQAIADRYYASIFKALWAHFLATEGKDSGPR